ncbi:MAG TPA: FAD/NAD(P)-binding protein [Candidatus Binatia bacterium]|nr:FAD/NAD(P)-binding protein [Candidatus Binatia bacterium]
MTRRRVAIVGGGFSGAVLAAHLARRGRASPEIVLIEKGSRFGPGLAYGGKDPAHLLNVRASNLSAFPDQPDHFVHWLGGRGAGRDVRTRFAQRMKYGAYIEHVLRRARSWGAPRIERLSATVVACGAEGARWALALDNGRAVEADAVVLALGNTPPSAPGFFKSADVPLVQPWDAEALKRMGHGDVLLLGTGLTAVDVALSFARMRRKGVVYALSRRGQLPRPHLQSAAPPAPHAMDVPLLLSDALFAVRKEAEAAVARGEPWQHVIDRLRARTPELWQRLPTAAQQRFLRHLRPWWDAHRHRMAPEIAGQIAKLQREGRLRVLAGEIVSAEREGPAIHVHHRQRGSMARHHFEVVGVVNCTGASMDLSASADPLVRQLFDDGLVRPHASGLGFDVDAEGRVIANSGAPHANLYALGPITQGVFWESTAIPEIRVRAAAIAAALAPDR